MPQGYKHFSMLNSAEHESLLVNEQQITDKYNIFLSLADCENFYAYKYENFNISWHFHIYQQRKFHAQMI